MSEPADWTRAQVEEVAPGVHRIPLPLPNDGLRAVNVYAIADESAGLTLVDSGWSIPPARERLVEMLAELGYRPGDITRFLVTHVHRDHYTMAVALRREFGTHVALGAGEQSSLEAIISPRHTPLDAQTARMRVLGAAPLADELVRGAGGPAPHVVPWELPDTWLTPVTLDVGPRKLEVVSTPGHTQGHVVFHDLDAGLLFAGDHVLPTITPSIGLEPVNPHNPLRDFLDSLAAVRARPDAKLLPAHGPVTDSVHDRVDQLIAHHGRRLDDMEAVALAGHTTAYEVAQAVKWTRRDRPFDDLDLYNRMLATGETGAHLDMLVHQKRLRAVFDDGVHHYLPPGSS
ncbi:MBL fold metallo-hydrolase [Mycobacterium colombiense]|uniref:MBL fold metallo-hydrolase n=1 Tax=Mycobacterium colombiense TaxID=339268 RepID=UPI0007EF72D5|nr:MBL fold metallo-hydrolase [Mycobacterium colombiense]OBK63282.1 MBL fold metallo-hydrolase [Mycobacterium colombiense]